MKDTIMIAPPRHQANHRSCHNDNKQITRFIEKVARNDTDDLLVVNTLKSSSEFERDLNFEGPGSDLFNARSHKSGDFFRIDDLFDVTTSSISLHRRHFTFKTAMFRAPTEEPRSQIRSTTVTRLHAKWTKAEDTRLEEMVAAYGPFDWVMISQRMENRNPRQCKERWDNYLREDLKRTEWTDSEDLLLFQKFHDLGPKWVQIAKYFPKRTDAMVKNRINLLKRHEQKRAEILAQHDPLVLHLFQLSAPAMPAAQNTGPVQQSVDTSAVQDVGEVGERHELFDEDLWFDPLFQGVFDELVEF
jgi:hypothetical protein